MTHPSSPPPIADPHLQRYNHACKVKMSNSFSPVQTCDDVVIITLQLGYANNAFWRSSFHSNHWNILRCSQHPLCIVEIAVIETYNGKASEATFNQKIPCKHQSGRYGRFSPPVGETKLLKHMYGNRYPRLPLNDLVQTVDWK